MGEQRGFTYLEVVLTLAIMAMVLTGVSLAFTSLYHRWEITCCRQDLLLNLQELRLQAINQGEAAAGRVITGEGKVLFQLGGKWVDLVFPSYVMVRHTGFASDGSFWFLPSGAPFPRAGTIILLTGRQRIEVVINVATGCVDVTEK